MLAFDHRASFQKGLFGISGTPTSDQVQAIADSKSVIYEGFRMGVMAGAPRESAAVLVDEQLGAAVARAARADGFLLAMPVEMSGQAEFDFQYGAEYRSHVEAFEPDFVKVLVRYNPEGDAALNARQLLRLAELSQWLREVGWTFLFELLVPAEPDQLAKLGGDAERYDRELRPRLVVETIAQAQAAGVEPDIWKLEGLETTEDCERVARQARDGGRQRVASIVLGRGESEERVLRWLEVAAAAGFAGFAVGRTVWADPLRGCWPTSGAGTRQWPR